MLRYKHEDWDFESNGGFDDRIYVDNNGNRITGIIEGFYGYTSNPSDEINCQYVKDGRRK